MSCNLTDQAQCWMLLSTVEFIKTYQNYLKKMVKEFLHSWFYVLWLLITSSAKIQWGLPLLHMKSHWHKLLNNLWVWCIQIFNYVARAWMRSDLNKGWKWNDSFSTCVMRFCDNSADPVWCNGDNPTQPITRRFSTCLQTRHNIFDIRYENNFPTVKFVDDDCHRFWHHFICCYCY